VRRVFVDTNYFAATLNERDQLRARAQEVGRELATLGDVRYVTLLANLGELMTFASNQGEAMRREAADFVERLLSSPDPEIIDDDRTLFNAARDFYRRRPDKTYSFIDCMAMVTCRQEGITEVLTGDRDFAREGLLILL
jgi:predicted nucleic acid-binding protein